jgi:hypothetical protein
LCARHLEPAPFGAITLDRLRATDVEALVLALREKGLSASTIRSTYTVLRAALDTAVRDVTPKRLRDLPLSPTSSSPTARPRPPTSWASA